MDNATETLDLQYTRSKRMQLIDKLSEKGAPSDIKEQSILLQALDGMDRAAMGKMKLKSDEGISSAQVQAAAVLAAIFNDPRTEKIGFDSGGSGNIPEFDRTIEPMRLLPGELSVVSEELSYEAFESKNNLE